MFCFAGAAHPASNIIKSDVDLRLQQFNQMIFFFVVVFAVVISSEKRLEGSKGHFQVASFTLNY